MIDKRAAKRGRGMFAISNVDVGSVAIIVLIVGVFVTQSIMFVRALRGQFADD